MSDPGKVDRISKTAMEVCLGTLLGLSVLAVVGRTVIRMRTRHRLYLDDAFLFFGLVCLCTATGFAYALLHSGYLEEGFVAHPNQTIPSDDVSKVLKRLRMVDVFVVFAWTAEFSVKVSLLLFFRQLVDRLPRLTTYVNFAMGFTVLVWAFLVGELFIVCQHLGIQTITNCVPPSKGLVTALSTITTVLDGLTDMITISIPVIVLWKTSMSNKNRLVLLTFLTMNVLLIIISIVRVSSYERDGVFDVRWTMFFQYLEPNIAILAACFTALRSLFVRRSSQAHGVEEGPVFLFQQKLFKQRSLDCRLLDDLPTVPEAAQTGSRTEI